MEAMEMQGIGKGHTASILSMEVLLCSHFWVSTLKSSKSSVHDVFLSN